MSKGNIIFLNGTSSSGKTSIALALQRFLEVPFLHISIDKFLQSLPARYIDILAGNQEPSEEEITSLQTYLPRILTGIHASIAALSSEGNNVIVDYVFEREDDLKVCVGRLADFPIFFVGVHCSLGELEHREKQRDRRQGLAKLQFEIVHSHKTYDFEVDTTQNNSDECAVKIKQAFEEQSDPIAFKTLKARLVK